jgi:hypothetical protein
MNHNPESDKRLLEIAKAVSGLRDELALAVIINEPLSQSPEGRKLLNSRDVSMADIGRLREILKLN